MGEDNRDDAGDDRRQRLAEQLRANLRRRKAQARARRGDEQGAGRDRAPERRDGAPETPQSEA
jgi:hypothetical protein